jgi:hypothetical protein
MDHHTETTMNHHVFTLSVGILIFIFIALNVANATDQGSEPAPNPPQVATLLENAQEIEIGNESGTIVQNQEEGGGSDNQAIEIGQDTHGDIIQDGNGTKEVKIKTP